MTVKKRSGGPIMMRPPFFIAIPRRPMRPGGVVVPGAAGAARPEAPARERGDGRLLRHPCALLYL